MDKRIKVSGFIDLPEGFDKLSTGGESIGTRVKIRGELEITGDGVQRKGRVEDGGELILTWTGTMQAGAQATSFELRQEQDTLPGASKEI